MTAQIVALHSAESQSATLVRIENTIRILAASVLAALDDTPALDASTMYDELMEIVERVSAAGEACDRAGSADIATKLLRIENSIRILATALFAEVDENPALDPSAMHDALIDIAERVAGARDMADYECIEERRRA